MHPQAGSQASNLFIGVLLPTPPMHLHSQRGVCATYAKATHCPLAASTTSVTTQRFPILCTCSPTQAPSHMESSSPSLPLTHRQIPAQTPQVLQSFYGKFFKIPLQLRNILVFMTVRNLEQSSRRRRLWGGGWRMGLQRCVRVNWQNHLKFEIISLSRPNQFGI